MLLFKEDTEKPVDIIQVQSSMSLPFSLIAIKHFVLLYQNILAKLELFVAGEVKHSAKFHTWSTPSHTLRFSLNQARGMKRQIMDEFVSNNKFLQVPRLVNQQLFDELCPVKQFHRRRK